MAQWITRLTTDQKIPGSTPGRIEENDILKYTNFRFIKDFKTIDDHLVMVYIQKYYLSEVGFEPTPTE